MIRMPSGAVEKCPAGFYAFEELQAYLRKQYHRPLHEIQVIQRCLYDLKQTASLEKYLMDLNHLLAETSITLPDRVYKAVVLKHMKPAVCQALMKKQGILGMSMQEFVAKATTIDDVDFSMSKSGRERDRDSNTDGKKPYKPYKPRRAASAVRAREMRLDSATVAFIKKKFVDPFTQEGAIFL